MCITFILMTKTWPFFCHQTYDLLHAMLFVIVLLHAIGSIASFPLQLPAFFFFQTQSFCAQVDQYHLSHKTNSTEGFFIEVWLARQAFMAIKGWGHAHTEAERGRHLYP